MAREQIAVQFGAMSPPLAEQLAHLDLPEESLDHWQRDADAIARLSIRDLLSESITHRARVKLMNRIVQAAGKASS